MNDKTFGGVGVGGGVQQSQFNVNVLSERVQWVDSDSKNIGSIIKHQHLLLIEQWKSQAISSFFSEKILLEYCNNIRVFRKDKSIIFNK